MHQILDLSVHPPEDYIGKYIICNDCEYEVGEFLGEGAERIVHRLRNCQSGLDLLVLKVIKQISPVRSLGVYTKIISKLRSDKNFSKIIPITIECPINGGLVELQENVGRKQDDGICSNAQCREGIEYLAQGKYDSAITAFNIALKKNEENTSASMNLAIAYSKAGQREYAQMHADYAVRVEPNVYRYWHNLMIFTADLGELHEARSVFLKSKSVFDHVHDMDTFGASLCSAVGEPQLALKYIMSSSLNSQEKEDHSKKLLNAVEKQTYSNKQMKAAKKLVDTNDWITAYNTLAQADAQSDDTPFLSINTALALYRATPQRKRDASKILVENSYKVSVYHQAFCLANAGFIEILNSSYTTAELLLGKAAMSLMKLTGGQISPHFADLPGLAIWMDLDSITEEKIENTRNVINLWVNSRNKKENNNPYLDDLLEAYVSAFEVT